MLAANGDKGTVLPPLLMIIAVMATAHPTRIRTTKATPSTAGHRLAFARVNATVGAAAGVMGKEAGANISNRCRQRLACSCRPIAEQTLLISSRT
ncbi:MAG: hypothetical protein NT031_03140, partial [Planctomycetota bacterium]|nr:hypothetical protein [Planctomycetota bacterium]